MEEQKLTFFFEDTPELDLSVDKYLSWLAPIITNHEHYLTTLNYIFCSDEYLLEINKEYLEHDYYTDIITFDNSDEEGVIEGDIFVSIDRVKENATTNKVPFNTELNRVIAHGLLHLLGFGDKSKEEEIEMRKNEDACLSLWQN